MPSASGGLAKSGWRASSCSRVSVLACRGLSFRGSGRSGHGAHALLSVGRGEPGTLARGSRRSASHERHAGAPPRGPRPPAYAYLDPAVPPTWQPDHVDAFTTPAFTGFVASDDNAAYLVFRGTKLQSRLRRSVPSARLQAWLANLDFAQVEEPAPMVHRGYARELDGVGEFIRRDGPRSCARRQAALRHRAQRRRRACHAGRAPPARGRRRRCARPFVFSAPRVGDRRFAATYPLPLMRLEHRHDLIPHLPLPPSPRPGARPRA